MVEGERRLGSDGESFWVEGENIDAVGVLFNEASDCDSLVVRVKGSCGRASHGVKRKRGFIGYGVFGSEVRLLAGVVHFLGKVAEN